MIAVPATGDLIQMVGQYIAEKTGMELVPGQFQAFMVINDQQDFVAAVAITNFRKTDCEISAASDSAVAWHPNVCKAVFTYVFEQLGCVRCTSITTKANKKARSFLERLGFELEGNLKLGYDGRRDALIYGLLRSDCRFLGGEGATDGQEIGTSSTASAGPGSDGSGSDRGQQGRGGNASELEPYRPDHARRDTDVLH